jgi:hypothetical protein
MYDKLMELRENEGRRLKTDGDGELPKMDNLP